MADAAPAPTPAVAPKKKGKLPLILVCILALGAGAAAPMVVNVPALMGKSKAEAEPKKHGPVKSATIPFGDVVVNLSEERMTRYLKLKIVLLVDAEQEKEATEHVAKMKAAMKSWMIGHVAGKTLKDVSGTAGVARLQREIFERFEDLLYPDGHGHLINVLFEEYVVQ